MTDKITRPETISFRVTSEEKEALEANAAHERRTMSQYLTMLFEDAIKAAVATAKRRAK